MTALLHPHLAHTADRCAAHDGTVIVPHDTSGFEYKGDTKRTGLGRIRTGSSQGFHLHASIGVAAETGRPLGLLASKVWVRGEERTSTVEGANGPRKKSGADYQKDGTSESNRWVEQMDEVEALLAGRGCKLIHVADREADIYAAIQAMLERQYNFVVRLSRDKKARLPDGTELEDLTTLARRAEGCVEVEAPISARPATTIPGRGKTFPARQARTARLQFAATTAEIFPPRYGTGSLLINVVHVRELDAPSPEQAIEWVLLTSEPVDTPEQVAAVVRAYRTRWLIEEFFKALKTGCSMEDRELESLHTLKNVLAICIPIAYQLLAIRHLARTEPEAPASLVLCPVKIEILQVKARLPLNPTAAQALQAIAYLGSHFQPIAKKMPGWIVFSRGMQRLLALEEGWLARDSKPIER